MNNGWELSSAAGEQYLTNGDGSAVLSLTTTSGATVLSDLFTGEIMDISGDYAYRHLPQEWTSNLRDPAMRLPAGSQLTMINWTAQQESFSFEAEPPGDATKGDWCVIGSSNQDDAALAASGNCEHASLLELATGNRIGFAETIVQVETAGNLTTVMWDVFDDAELVASFDSSTNTVQFYKMPYSGGGLVPITTDAVTYSVVATAVPGESFIQFTLPPQIPVQEEDGDTPHIILAEHGGYIRKGNYTPLSYIGQHGPGLNLVAVDAVVAQFAYSAPDWTGSISGIVDTSQLALTGPVMVGLTLHPETQPTASGFADALSGAYSIGGLADGDYYVCAIMDTNLDGNYDYLTEPVGCYADPTVTVSGGLETTGIDFVVDIYDIDASLWSFPQASYDEIRFTLYGNSLASVDAASTNFGTIALTETDPGKWEGSYPSGSVPLITSSESVTLTLFDGVNTESRTVIVEPTGVVAPVSVYPDQDAVISSALDFSWDLVAGASGYRVELSGPNGFNWGSDKLSETTSNFAYNGPELVDGAYSWNLQVLELNGNRLFVSRGFDIALSTTEMIDTDFDGIDDNWEMAWFGDLTTVNDTSDFDSDGILDIDEFKQETNPTVVATSFISTPVTDVAGLLGEGFVEIDEWSDTGVLSYFEKDLIQWDGTTTVDASYDYDPHTASWITPTPGADDWYLLATGWVQPVTKMNVVDVTTVQEVDLATGGTIYGSYTISANEMTLETETVAEVLEALDMGDWQSMTTGGTPFTSADRLIELSATPTADSYRVGVYDCEDTALNTALNGNCNAIMTTPDGSNPTYATTLTELETVTAPVFVMVGWDWATQEALFVNFNQVGNTITYYEGGSSGPVATTDSGLWSIVSVGGTDVLQYEIPVTLHNYVDGMQTMGTPIISVVDGFARGGILMTAGVDAFVMMQLDQSAMTVIEGATTFDVDHDGVSDVDENAGGTDPTIPNTGLSFVGTPADAGLTLQAGIYNLYSDCCDPSTGTTDTLFYDQVDWDGATTTIWDQYAWNSTSVSFDLNPYGTTRILNQTAGTWADISDAHTVASATTTDASLVSVDGAGWADFTVTFTEMDITGVTMGSVLSPEWQAALVSTTATFTTGSRWIQVAGTLDADIYEQEVEDYGPNGCDTTSPTPTAENCNLVEYSVDLGTTWIPLTALSDMEITNAITQIGFNDSTGVGLGVMLDGAGVSTFYDTTGASLGTSSYASVTIAGVNMYEVDVPTTLANGFTDGDTNVFYIEDADSVLGAVVRMGTHMVAGTSFQDMSLNSVAYGDVTGNIAP